MGLYNIPQEMEYINHLIDESNGEITEEIEAEIKKVENQILPKIDQFCRWIRSLESGAEADKNESAFFSKRKVQENTANRIKKLILDALISMGQEKAHGERFKISVQKASRPKITWEEKDPIPKKFTRTVIEPDGDMIYQAYKDGKLPKGFKVTFSNYIRIS